jgi:hypothetical protein
MCVVDDITVLEVETLSTQDIELENGYFNFTPNTSRPMGFDEFNAFIDQISNQESQEI